MKTRLMIPALIAAATFSSGAFAQGGDRDHDQRDNRRDQQRYERRVVHMPPPPPVHVQRTYHPAPRGAYYQPAAYRPAQVYHVAPPRPHDSQRVVGQAIGAVAGGIVGHQVGNGEFAPTLIGAVIGGVIGNQFARY